MTKEKFNNLSVSNQINYFNTRLNKGETITHICKTLNISYSTIRDRFKRNDYIYNNVFNRYEKSLPHMELTQETLENFLVQFINKTNTLSCHKKDSKLITRSFRIHSCVLDDFVDFCNSSNFTQQEILSQFIQDGLNKYKF